MEFTMLVLIFALTVAGVDAFMMSSRASSLVTHEVFFDMAIEGRGVGRIILGLFGEVAPMTVENFLYFSTQPKGKGYKDSVIHRVVKGHVLQGGDFLHGNGSGLTSLFDGQPFEDESFVLKHNGAGWVGMANAGEDTNTCQFYITFTEISWMDGKHVIFGKVVDGMDVTRMIENIATDDKDRPKKEVRISNCGEIPVGSPFRVNTKVGSDEL